MTPRTKPSTSPQGQGLTSLKEWLKSVLNYSYPKIKLGICFLDHPVYKFRVINISRPFKWHIAVFGVLLFVALWFLSYINFNDLVNLISERSNA